MKRQVARLGEKKFDALVIGAGIYGAAVARDAAMRGLKVALIDKDDFCGKTSHNSLKIIHGGLRYLQHLNFKRTLESIQEQSIWLEVAPHLVKPLPCVMPTYGHLMRGPEAMWAGIKLFQLMRFGRNRRLTVDRKISRGKILSKKDCLSLLPNINTKGLTGAALWYDAQVFDADRAVIEMIISAAEEGAVVANYVEAKSLVIDGNRVAGAVVRDNTDNQEYQINSKYVINTAGPWAKQLIEMTGQKQAADYDLPLTESMNIVTRPLFGKNAIALNSKIDSDSVVGATKRLYFFTPWKGCQAIGTTHFSYSGNPDDLLVKENEVQQFIDEINQVYEGLNLSLDDVSYCYKGLTPAADDKDNGSRAHEGRILDHQKDGLDGFISMVGVKYTTARLEAEKTVNLLANKLQIKAKCQTRTKSLPGLNEKSTDLEDLDEDAFSARCKQIIEQTAVVNLSDLLLRRMDLAARGLLTKDHLERCVQALIDVKSWDQAQTLEELNDLDNTWFNPSLRSDITELKKAFITTSPSKPSPVNKF